MNVPTVLLAFPPRPESDRGRESVLYPNPPFLGLAQLAAILDREDIAYRIIQERDLRQFLQRIKEADASAIRWVGFSAHSLNFWHLTGSLPSIRDVAPNARVVLGGPHATSAPDDALNLAGIDVVVRGDAEKALPELIRQPRVEDVPSVSFRKQNEIVHHAAGPPTDLDALPLPRYDLFRPFRPTIASYLKKPVFPYQASRGCPFSCGFCRSSAEMAGRRQRSVARILDDMNQLTKDHGAREIQFVDNIFLPNPADLERFCQGLLDRGRPIVWSCMAHFNMFEESLARLMVAAGCHQVGFGMESSDPQLLRDMKKPINVEAARLQISRLASAGLNVRVHFMYGYPGETRETMAKTLRMALRLRAAMATFSTAMAFPGTALERRLVELGVRRTTDWSRLNGSYPSDFAGLAKKQVFSFATRSILRFYLRPVILLRNRQALFNINFLRDGLILLGMLLRMLLSPGRRRHENCAAPP